jgi:hypothetical protein
MSPVAQHISVQPKEIIQDESEGWKGSQDVQKQVEIGKENSDKDNHSSVLHTLLCTITG